MRLIMKTIKIILTGVTFLMISLSAPAYSNSGSWSSPDFYGNSRYSGSNGVTGTLSAPDFYGNSRFNFSDGTSGYIGKQDFYGNTRIYWD